MERRPIRIGRCRKAFLNAGSDGLLAGLLAGLGWGGHTPSKLLRRLFTRHPYMLRISRFVPPVYHLASLGWLRQSSSRPIPAVCVRLPGSWSIDLVVAQIRWCLPRAKQAAGINLCMSDIRGTAVCGFAWV